LIGKLRWAVQDGAGELISKTTLHVSHESYFRERLPWRIGMVRLDIGVTVIVHLHAACPSPPGRVLVRAQLDRSGQGVLMAFPTQQVPNMADDGQLLEMTANPQAH
jgi:hypothetical protein